MTRRVRYDVIARRFLAGWSIEECCERLGCTEDDVEQAIRRAMNRGCK